MDNAASDRQKIKDAGDELIGGYRCVNCRAPVAGTRVNRYELCRPCLYIAVRNERWPVKHKR